MRDQAPCARLTAPSSVASGYSTLALRLIQIETPAASSGIESPDDLFQNTPSPFALAGGPHGQHRLALTTVIPHLPRDPQIVFPKALDDSAIPPIAMQLLLVLEADHGNRPSEKAGRKRGSSPAWVCSIAAPSTSGIRQ